jgi:hypothetical protein
MRARFLPVMLWLGLMLGGCGSRTVYVTMAPPAARGEVPPPKPHHAYVWIPGHWDWHAGRHVWVAGYWAKPKPGCQWAPGYWKQTEQGWAWNEGQWKKESPGKKEGHRKSDAPGKSNSHGKKDKA